MCDTLKRFHLFFSSSLTGDPLHPAVPVRVHPAQPVVGPVLRVDDVQDVLDEGPLFLGQHVSQVAAHLVASLFRLELPDSTFDQIFFVCLEENSISH